VKQGIVKQVRDGIKILGKGDLTKSLTVHAHRFSAKAKERITGLGGKVEVLER
jgi:large subunit ribosomal protein L15